ncbi:DUF1330 domain-containing protein [Novosphingobium piscinae]|uniref:DUF1330 domain-containing protein n=1 Tax=Novosphingobium piscinae TaxID=1507448 RepID=A0A7X1FZJ4_9SPHN|nr:DUF1330 domain-containing protein [Novosphingobium piscinae]MBC2669893.1 DUF1330 domain-containing protein [Novosphingobium piscinae]
MAAWLVVTATIPDREAFLACGYTARSAELLQAAGGRYVIRAPGAAVLEGDGQAGSGPGPSVVISEWPDRASALAFWNSPEYQAAKALRAGLAEIDVLLVGA